MFRRMEYSAVKGKKNSLHLNRVTLFNGPHRSGKSAAMESARLASTGTCSFGASNRLVAELVNGDEAWSQISGDELIGTVTIKCGRSNSVRHLLTDLHGIEQHVESVLAKLPVTSAEFWSLSGEAKWQAIESVVGTFSSKEPPSIDPLVEQLKLMRNATAPDNYHGASIDSLQERINEIDQFVRQAREKLKHKKYNEQLLADHKAELERKQAGLSRLEAELIDSDMEAVKLEQDIEQLNIASEMWSMHPMATLQHYGDSPHDAWREFTRQTAETYSAFVNAGAPKIAFEELMLSLKLSEEPFAAPQCAQAIMDLTNRWATSPNGMDSLLKEMKNRSQSIRNTIDSTKNEIAKLSQTIEGIEGDASEIIDDAEVEAKLEEAKPLRAELAKANDWQAWVESFAERSEKIQKLEAELEAGKAATIKWRQDRNDYLKSCFGKVEAIMNGILADMSWEPVKLDVVASGTKQSLVIKTGASDSINAMAGVERVVYGAAMLNALQMLSRSKCPVMFIEAAEISGDVLPSFLSALAKHRDKGNVFVAHYSPWVGGKVDGVGVIDCGGA